MRPAADRTATDDAGAETAGTADPVPAGADTAEPKPDPASTIGRTTVTGSLWPRRLCAGRGPTASSAAAALVPEPWFLPRASAAARPEAAEDATPRAEPLPERAGVRGDDESEDTVPEAPAEPVVSANAAGADNAAEPTPNATANAPNRPTYRAGPDTTAIGAVLGTSIRRGRRWPEEEAVITRIPDVRWACRDPGPLPLPQKRFATEKEKKGRRSL